MKLNPRESRLSLMNIQKAKPNASESRDQVFEQYFEQYWALVYRLLTRVLGDPDEAEDIALETFYRLYQHHPDPEPEFNIGGWLVRVSTNLGLHAFRSFKRRQGYELNAGKRNLEDAA